MQQVQSGDLRKMGELYERYRRKLFGYFYHMNGDPGQSEDLVHSVFVRLIDYRHTFSGSGSFASWVFRTARNLQYDQYRKQARDPVRNAEEVVQESPEPAELQSEEYAEADLKKLRLALTALPAAQREILVLSKIEGLTYKEIGAVLDCTDGAAKVRAHRALKALRTNMITSK
jgi:RNA polymerase sigma-70 factor (ECF subfamily)